MTKKLKEHERYNVRQICISLTCIIFQIITIGTSSQINTLYRQQSDNIGFSTISYIQITFAGAIILYYFIKFLFDRFYSNSNLDKNLLQAAYYLIFDIVTLMMVVIETVFSIIMHIWTNNITIKTNPTTIYQLTVINIVFLILTFVWTFGYTYMSYGELCTLLAMRKVIESLPCCKYQLVANNGVACICSKCLKNFASDDLVKALPNDSLYHFNCLNDIASDFIFVKNIENMLDNKTKANNKSSESSSVDNKV